MVVDLGPGKFYGSSLPRPRIYTDVKLNDERVDPPLPVLDPLMSWAEEAHWSMGGLSFNRHRLQGRIEGSIKKLRAERERFLKKKKQTATATAANQIGTPTDCSAGVNTSPSPPPAPIAMKRRRFMALVDDDENDEGLGVGRRLARKLGDDFERVAVECGLGKNRGSPLKTSNDGSNVVKLKKGCGKVRRIGENGGSSGTRTSPRLAKRGST